MSISKRQSIDFSSWLYYDETSPTGLRWKVDVFTGEHYKAKLVSKGDVAGSIRAEGISTVSVNGVSYFLLKSGV